MCLESFGQRKFSLNCYLYAYIYFREVWAIDKYLSGIKIRYIRIKFCGVNRFNATVQRVKRNNMKVLSLAELIK